MPGDVGGGGVRRAPGEDHHRHPVALGVVQRPAQVQGACVDVHHDGLRRAAGEVVPHGRGQRHELVQAQHRARARRPILPRRGERFLNRGGVGAGVDEQVLHALVREGGDQLGRRVHQRAPIVIGWPK